MQAKRLLTGLLVALGVSFLFTMWLSRKLTKPAAAVSAKQQYVAAAKDLQAGQALAPTDLTMIDWPAGSKLDGAFQKTDALNGRVLLYPLSANQPIVERQLSTAGSGVGLSTKIPEGMRAIALKSDEVAGVAGFMLPGTHVDVLVTYHNGSDPDPVTATVLQDVQILAIGQKTAPDPDGKATTADVVTLLVNPNDAQKAVLACAQGTVHFVLRNGADHDQVSDKPTQLTGLRPTDGPKPMKMTAAHNVVVLNQPVAKPYQVETENGDKKATESIQ